METGCLGGGRVRTTRWPRAAEEGGSASVVLDTLGGMSQGKGRRSSPGVGPSVGGMVPLWASELSPEGAASRSQGHLPKGWPIQKTAAKSVQVGTRRQSPPGALGGGTDGAGLLPHTCKPTAPFIQRTHSQARAGGRHTGSLPLQRPGWVRSCAQMGAQLKLSPSGLHRAGPPPGVTPPRTRKGPHSHSRVSSAQPSRLARV